jgi:hypothetical protein
MVFLLLLHQVQEVLEVVGLLVMGQAIVIRQIQMDREENFFYENMIHDFHANVFIGGLYVLPRFE